MLRRVVWSIIRVIHLVNWGSTSETSVNFYQMITGLSVPEESSSYSSPREPEFSPDVVVGWVCDLDLYHFEDQSSATGPTKCTQHWRQDFTLLNQATIILSWIVIRKWVSQNVLHDVWNQLDLRGIFDDTALNLSTPTSQFFSFTASSFWCLWYSLLSLFNVRSIWLLFSRCHALSLVITLCHSLSWMITRPFSHVCHSYWCFITHGYSFWRLVTLFHVLSRFATSLLFVKLVQCQVVLGYSLHVVTLCHSLSRFVTRYHEFSLLAFFLTSVTCWMFHHTWSQFLAVRHS
jgi:hypothetical protein